MLDHRSARLGVRGCMGCRFGGRVLVGVVGAWLSRSLLAQQGMACHSGVETPMGIADPATLAAPEKMTGIGNGSMTITAANDDPKMWFNQGLNLLHDFWDYEAARAFEQAVRADANCAMCYWGLY